MSDGDIVRVGRNLAKALKKFARDREPIDRQAVAILQTELCSVVDQEELKELMASDMQKPEPQ
jgi:hypothetical protein